MVVFRTPARIGSGWLIALVLRDISLRKNDHITSLSAVLAILSAVPIAGLLEYQKFSKGYISINSRRSGPQHWLVSSLCYGSWRSALRIARFQCDHTAFEPATL